MVEEIVELMVLKGVLTGALGPKPFTHCRVYDASPARRFLRVEPTPRWIEDTFGVRGREVVLRARVDLEREAVVHRELAIRWSDSFRVPELRHIGGPRDPLALDDHSAKMLLAWHVPNARWSHSTIGRLEKDGATPTDELHVASIAARATSEDIATVYRFAERAEIVAGSFSDVVRHFAIDLETLPAVIRSHPAAPSWLERVDVGEMTNADGEPALRVTLVVRPDVGARVLDDGEQLERGVEVVHEVFRQMAVERWPYTRFVSASEAA